MLTKKQINLIIGSTLGDASITKSRNKQQTACIRFTHSVLQKAYCWHKASILKDISNHMPCDKTYFLKNHNKLYTSTRYSSKYLNELYSYYELFYDNGVKRISDSIKDYINEESLAIWYMDDGSIETFMDKGGRRKTPYIGNKITFHTNGFDIKSCEILRDCLNNKFGFNFRIRLVGKKKQPILQTKSRQSIEKFISLITPHVIKEMNYKIQTSYVNKRIKKIYSKEEIKRISETLDVHSYSDCMAYKRGQWLYDNIRKKWGSINNLARYYLK